MSIQLKAFIFTLRSRMIDVKCNFKAGKTDLNCRKCLKEEENQEHLLSCASLADNSVVSSSSDTPIYQDLFSDNKHKIKTIGQILHAKFKLLTQPSAQFTSAAATPQ